MKKDVESIVKQVTDKIIKDMESADPAKWVKCWANKKYQSLEGHYYSGFNILWLSLQSERRPIYGTFLQWKAKGLRIKKGSKATQLLLYRPFSKEVENKEGEKETKTFRLLKTFNVFNIEDVEGDVSKWDGVEDNKSDGAETIKRAEDYVNNLNAKIDYIEGSSKACYTPALDKVTMPSKNSFIKTNGATATENFYCVLFHELTHWTGADHRLKRGKGNLFGSPEYAFEELVAELGSAYVANSLDISAQPRADHSHYLKSWIRCLKDKPNALLNASGLANKALIYMNDLQPKAIKNKELLKDKTKQGFIKKVEVQEVA